MAGRKQVSRSKAVKALDKAFSEWVRLSGASRLGLQQCYTCNIMKHYKEMDAGHFQSRAKYSTRWDPMNVKPQCKRCNMTNGGQQYEFGLRLDAQYGSGTAQNLLIKSNQIVKIPTREIIELTHQYRQKVKELQNAI